MSKYKITDLIVESFNSSKSIIMAGSAGAGKTTFVKQIQPDLDKNKWLNLNADKYVEDKNSEYYNNVTGASKHITKNILPSAISTKRNFLYDTTGSNIALVEQLKNAPGYKSIMVMVYTHPIISFFRNFNRERKVPTVGVLSSWNSVYKNLDHYKKLFGSDFYLVQMGASVDENKLVEKFNDAHKHNKLHEFFESLLSTGQFKSTFRKDPTAKSTPEQIAASKEAVKKQIDLISSQFDTIQDQVNLLSKVDNEKVFSKVKSFINE